MPEISRFFGIVIAIFYDDHNPPHFHARYGEEKAIIDINTLTIRTGTLSGRALGLILEWAALHKTELLKNWELSRKQEPLLSIEPLK
ncbi:DUF4160 domain-containing protein [Candidatus Saganbacteria bacterium]|nr:DUF4160 domain-containing protein [Candidatus Saganbacteria bacterium]